MNTNATQQATIKPELSFFQIWNMCFGFLGIQFGFALQISNVSRIFQTLGAEIDEISILWVAAPLTGLLVQPIVGYYSDRTWTPLGRRKPYFLYGAIATSLALIIMPNASVLWVAAGALWLLDASINITTEPFRAFVGDMLPKQQRPKGFLMQSFFIGIGSVIASASPWIFANWFGMDNTAPEGQIPATVQYSFYIGAAVLFLAVLWTVLKTREYTPQQLSKFAEHEGEGQQDKLSAEKQAYQNQGNFVALFWLCSGLFSTLVVLLFGLEKRLYLLTLGILLYGILQLINKRHNRDGSSENLVLDIAYNLAIMPRRMRQLAWVQFFSWVPFFCLWTYSTAGVAERHFNSTDPTSLAYNAGADWVGILFAGYNGFAALAAMIIPFMIRRSDLKKTHQINLLLGALGLGSMLIINDPNWLLLSMAGVGFAWASILSIPYALLSDSLPHSKMGVYMGIFNFFIVIPQIVAAAALGIIVKELFMGHAIYAMLIGAVSWLIAMVCVFFVSD